MSIVIDELEIQIQKQSTNAASSLDDLSKAFSKLNRTLSASKDGVSAMDKLSNSMKSLNTSIGQLSSENVKRVMLLADAMHKLASASKEFKGASGISKQIKDVSKAVSAVSESSAEGSASGNLGNTPKASPFSKIKIDLEGIRTGAQNALKPVKKLFSSIGRIALYRAVRTGLKAISEGFSEGLANAYEFSKLTKGELYTSLNRLASVNLQLKNQLGAMYGELINSFAPAIEKIVNALIHGANTATEFFAALNGANQYKYAKEVSIEWDSAAASVKKYKNQLLGLDELNNISSGNGNDTKKSAEDMFEYRKISEEMKNITAGLKVTFNDAFFDWDKKMTGKKLFKKILTALNTLTGAYIGFKLGGVPGAIVGSIGAAMLSTKITDMLFKKGTKMSKTELRSALYPVLGAISGGFIGFGKSGVKGALIGMSIGASIGTLISKFTFKNDTNGEYANEDALGGILADVLTAVTGGIIGFEVAGFKGALVGFSIGALATVLIDNFRLEDGTNGAFAKEDVLRDLLNPVLGAITGGLLGFELGGVNGALFGMTLGVSLGTIVNHFMPEDGTNGKYKNNTNALGGLFKPVMSAITGATIGWKIGSTKGAILGASIGFVAGLLLNDIGCENGTRYGAQDVLRKLISKEALGGIVAGAIALGLTGNPTGAVLGFTIGFSLTMLLEDLHIENKLHDVGKTLQESTVGQITTSGGSTINLLPGQDIGKIIDPEYGGDTPSERLENLWEAIKGVFGKFGFTAKASGGVVTRGSMFLAGEAGAEFIGNIGNTSAVANTEQMTDILKSATYAGVTAALQNGGLLGGLEPASAEDVYFAVKKVNNRQAKMTGGLAW